MRVVMVGPFGLRPKTTMRVRALPLAKALAVRGHQVTLLLPPWSCPEDSGKAWEEDGVRIENIVLPAPIPLLQHICITWRLVRRAIALRPDVVHCFKPKAYAGLTAWALWWLRRLGLTHARLVVDGDDWEGAGGWNELEAYSWAQKRVFAWQEQWGLRHNDALTLASRTLQSIAWSIGVPPRRVWYVPNGVNEWRMANGEWQIANGQMAGRVSQAVDRGGEYGGGGGGTVLLYTRFFEFELQRVVDVLDRVHKAKPGVRFTVAGRGLFGEEDRFLELCRAAGLAGAVEYVGWSERVAEALPGIFALADVAIYPFDDTLINRTKCAVKLLELMAAGVPVVAEAVGQNAVTIVHGISGLLTGPGDGAAMAEAVLDLLNDPGLRERLGRGAQRRIREHLTWERLSAQVEVAYGGEEK
jgi:glycosyltransferase involved in cell wall biosynthesis